MIKEWYKNYDTPFDLIEPIGKQFFCGDKYLYDYLDKRKKQKYCFNVRTFVWTEYKN